MIFRRIYAKLMNEYYKRRYKKMHAQARVLAFIKNMTLKGKAPFMSPTREYYNNYESLNEIAEIARKAKGKIDTIYVGDSLGDFTRDKLSAVEPEGNYCRSGDTWRGFKDVLDTVGMILGGKRSKIKTVFLGTGGNNALQYQDVRSQNSEMTAAFNAVRKYFPCAKIVFIGFPPIYDVYANLCAPVVEQRMQTLADADGNASVIYLHDFAGKWGILPTLEMSADGTHFSEYGAYEFDLKLLDAKKCVKC